MPIVNLTEYARHRGIHRNSVLDAIKRGVLVSSVREIENRGKMVLAVDLELADKEWAENSDLNQVRNLPKTEKGKALLEQGLKERQSKVKAPPFQESRAIREAYTARITKLEYEERINKLVDVEKVKKINWEVARRVRDAILYVPNKIAAEVAVETDPFKVEKIINDALKEALIEI